ncbi:hypothetical protein V2I01_27295 [Micromonospora sp. BRA006-A]|nr:hypothetical protein [Micromonospora sp. BRA006-A]
MSNGAEPFAPHDDLSGRPRFDPGVARLRQTSGGPVRRADRRRGERADRRAGPGVRAGARPDRAGQRAQAEAVELRDRPSAVDRASFRDLGPMVDQILDLAEKQAGQITDVATRRAEEVQGQAEKLLAAAQEQAARERRELDEELSARRPSRSGWTRSGGRPRRRS